MSKKTKQESDLDLLESSEAVAEQISKGEEFIKKNSNLLTYILVGIAAILGGGVYVFNTYLPEMSSEASEEMFQAQYYFESSFLDQNNIFNGGTAQLKKADTILNYALDGNTLEGKTGFLSIAEDYSLVKEGKLANFYAGACYMKKAQVAERLAFLEKDKKAAWDSQRNENLENAIEYFNEFSSSDLLLQARAYALVGDANMDLGNFDEAISSYKKAKEYKPNMYFTPTYLMKLALAYEASNDYGKAASAYNEIITEFPQATLVNDAKKYKALAEGLMNK